MKRLLLYLAIFSVILACFYAVLFRYTDFNKPKLVIINDKIQDFNFIDQNGKPFTKQNTNGKVYVAEFFFTTCTNICPVMNANLRKVYDIFKSDSNFLIASHTCLPEVDSVPRLKQYERKTILGTLVEKNNIAKIIPPADTTLQLENKNWFFLTGNKQQLYEMAKNSYMLDNPKAPLDTTKPFEEQFIHTQFISVVDKYGRVRKVYDALKIDEINELKKDIADLIKERNPNKNFVGGVKTTPN